jgi:hypothetical protein
MMQKGRQAVSSGLGRAESGLASAAEGARLRSVNPANIMGPAKPVLSGFEYKVPGAVNAEGVYGPTKTYRPGAKTMAMGEQYAGYHPEARKMMNESIIKQLGPEHGSAMIKQLESSLPGEAKGNWFTRTLSHPVGGTLLPMGLMMGIDPAMRMFSGPDEQQQRVQAAQGMGMRLGQAASLGDEAGFQRVLGSQGMHPAIGGALQRMWADPQLRQHLANPDAASNVVYQMHQHLGLNPNLTGDQLAQVVLGQIGGGKQGMVKRAQGDASSQPTSTSTFGAGRGKDISPSGPRTYSSSGVGKAHLSTGADINTGPQSVQAKTPHGIGDVTSPTRPPGGPHLTNPQHSAAGGSMAAIRTPAKPVPPGFDRPAPGWRGMKYTAASYWLKQAACKRAAEEEGLDEPTKGRALARLGGLGLGIGSTLPVGPIYEHVVPAGHQFDPAHMSDLAKAVGVDPTRIRYQHDSPLGPAYSPHGTEHHIHPGANPRVATGVMAHELGHARVQEMLQRRLGQRGSEAALLMGTSLPAQVGGLGGLIGGAFGSRRGALAGSLITLPTLLNEMAASHLGGRGMLRHFPSAGAGERVKSYLSAWRGVPSYGLMTAMPWLGYGGNRLVHHLRGDDVSKQGSAPLTLWRVKQARAGRPFA